MNLAIIIPALLLLAAFSGIAGAKGNGATFDPLFRSYADDPKLAKAVGMVESSLNPGAMGDGGRAYGIMQIWLPTAQGHGYIGTPYGLLDPATNIYYATRELNHLVESYGFERGIMGYNIGETKLRKGVSNPAYLDKVLKHYGRITV